MTQALILSNVMVPKLCGNVEKQNLNRLTNNKLAWPAFLSDITGGEFELWVEIAFHFLGLVLLTRIPIDISNDNKAISSDLLT